MFNHKSQVRNATLMVLLGKMSVQAAASNLRDVTVGGAAVTFPHYTANKMTAAVGANDAAKETAIKALSGATGATSTGSYGGY